MELSCSGSLFTCPVTPTPDTRQLGMPHKPLKLFKPANPNPAYLALPVTSHATTVTALVCTSSLPLCLTTSASAFLRGLRGIVGPLLLGTVCNKLSFQCQLSPDLWALLYLYLNCSINIQYLKQVGKTTKPFLFPIFSLHLKNHYFLWLLPNKFSMPELLVYIHYFPLKHTSKSNVVEYKEHRSSSGLASHLDQMWSSPMLWRAQSSLWRMRGHVVTNQGTLANSQH